MYLEDMARPILRALATSSTSTSFTAKEATATEPTGDGVIDLTTANGGIVPRRLRFMPIGTGDDNDVFAVRLYGWSRYGNNSNTLLWIPHLITELTCTLCARTGVAGKLMVATERFCDTIVVAKQPLTTDGGGATRGDIWVHSPTGDLIAWGEMPLYGFTKIEPEFDMTTGDPTNGNILLSPV